MPKILLIYFVILGISIVLSLFYKKGSSWKDKSFFLAKFYLIYYFLICLFHTLTGNGAQFLSTSFADKTIRAYIEVGILGIAVFAAIGLFIKLTKEKGENYLDKVVVTLSSLYLLYTVFVDLPRMNVIVVFGGIALIVGTIFVLLETKGALPWLFKQEISIKRRYEELGVVVWLFCSLFLLNGPVELHTFNSNGFAFLLGDFFPYMLLYVVLMLLPIVVIVSKCLPDKMFLVVRTLIFFYCVCSYVQQMFMNGSMDKMEGIGQEWNGYLIIGNLFAWIGLIFLVGFAIYKSKKESTIIVYTSAFIAGVQMITLVTLLITSLLSGEKPQQLVRKNIFNLSANENIVIFILDAYDTQMLDKMLESDGAYLEPLHDFTYYDEMSSRYLVTDSSLPYFLTGRIAEEEKDHSDIYSKSTFLQDISKSGYDISILTDKSYVEPFEDGLITNRTEDFYYVLDYEKTVSIMAKCVRYRTAPFFLKPYFFYRNYELTDVVYDSNAYVFGTDAEFYADMSENGIYIDESLEHAMKIYHLHGAHTPYYLTEDATIDFNSNPIAQWKGCLKIVYDYLEQMKNLGLYDKTSVIIMADHGLNGSHRKAMEEWNITVTEESNPIFFIKRAGQKQEQLEIDSRSVSHDDFFATVMKLINENNEQYGKAVWEN